jgi:hypothetical protein
VESVFDSRQDQVYASLHHNVDTESGARSASMDIRVSFPGGKATEVENAWSYTSTPQCVAMAWCLTSISISYLIIANSYKTCLITTPNAMLLEHKEHVSN